jgi:hypothetical protein
MEAAYLQNPPGKRAAERQDGNHLNVRPPCCEKWELDSGFGSRRTRGLLASALRGFAYGGNARAHALLPLCIRIAGGIGQIAGPLGNVATGFLSAHGSKQDSQPKPDSKSNQEAFHADSSYECKCSRSAAQSLKDAA